MNLKRSIIAGAVAATLAGGAFAFANSLTVNNQDLAAGSSAVNSGCPSISVAWDGPSLSYVAASTRYELGTINLTGGTAACQGRNYKVTVAGASGASLKEYTGVLSATTTGTAAISAGGDHIDANAVQSVTAVLTS